MSQLEIARAFVMGYLEQAENETKRGEPVAFDFLQGLGIDFEAAIKIQEFADAVSDYWYERGIKDLAELVLPKLSEKK